MKLEYSWKRFVLVSVLTLHCSAIAPALAQDRGTNTPPVKIKFRPPATGAPSVRVTGGSRGTGDSSVALDVLAPEVVGMTTQAQPSLFWYQSKPSPGKLEITLLQENKPKPLLQIKQDRPSQAGVQRVKLADHGVKLTPGIEYQWVVALVTDPENRSSDLVSSGAIKRIDPPSGLHEKTASANGAALANAYAEAGIWYDAVAALSDAIDAHPSDKSLRQARADLLLQVGLKAAAQADR